MATLKTSDHDYKQVTRFCADVQTLLKTVEVYTIEHIGSLEAAVRLMGSFRLLAADNGVVSITPVDDVFQVGKVLIPLKVAEKNQVMGRVCRLFNERKILVIAIKPDVSSDDFLWMAKTLTAPFEPTVAEHQYEELNLTTGSRIVVSSRSATIGVQEGKMLPLLLSGKLPALLNKSTRKTLFWEITNNVESSAWAIQKQLRWELRKDSPLSIRDFLTAESDRWVHILGEVMERVHADGDTSSAEGQKEILKLMLPYLATISVDRRSEEFNRMMSQADMDNIREMIGLFAQYYDSVLQRVEDLAEYRERVRELMKQLDQLVHAETVEKNT